MKSDKINLGYLNLSSWKKGDKLFSSWMYEPKNYPEYKKEIESTKPHEIILPPNKEYNLVITYPLSKKFETTVKTGEKGLTREEVVDLIVRCYKFIYDEEEATSKIKSGQISDTFLNRNQTDGDYGIWGHVLSDLILHTLYVKGDTLEIGVDS